MKNRARSWLLLAVLSFTVLASGCAHPFARSTDSGEMMSDGYYKDYDMSTISYEESAVPMMDAVESSYGFDDAGGPADVEQKIIRSGSLSLHVDDVQETVNEIQTLVPEWGGSLLYVNVSRGEASYMADLQVRVPADGFDSAMENLKGISLYVDNEWSSADDVTEAYMDLEARLSNAYAEEQAYLDLLNQSGSVTEILEVTRSLSDVRSEIEYMENQIEYYDTRVAYSLIDIYLTEDDRVSAVTEDWRPVGTVNNAFGAWVAFLQGLLDAVIYLLIFGWPFALIGLVVWRWLHRDSKKKKK